MIDKMRYFVKRLNKRLVLLDYSSSPGLFLKRLQSVVAVLSHWNESVFNLDYFNLDLVVYQVPRERYPDQHNTVALLDGSKTGKLEEFVRRLHRAKSLFSLYDVRY